jgi:3-oxoacyl-[acyl-carrier-protein] synthase II
MRLAELGFRDRPADAALVVSCANSTPRLDQVESVRLAALLGDAAAPTTWVTSIKGAVGEFGAAGALGAAAAVMALASGDAPRLGSLREPDTGSTLTLAQRHLAPPAGGFTEALVHCVPRGGGAVSVLFRRP